MCSWRGPGRPWEALGGQDHKRVPAISFLEASWGGLGPLWGAVLGALGTALVALKNEQKRWRVVYF